MAAYVTARILAELGWRSYISLHSDCRRVFDYSRHLRFFSVFLSLVLSVHVEIVNDAK